MDFNFYMPVKVISSKDAVLSHDNVFSSFGKNCLIVSSRSAKRNGALDDVITVLERNQIGYKIFDEITQNPKAADCHRAGQVARDYFAEFIVGIGGGSALDGAKAAAVYASNKALEPEDIYSGNIMLSPLPLILIGTTAGTGSEVTGVSVLTRENGKKKSVSGPDYYAKIAFADPKYTYSVPYNFTVSTALDAFAHATESWFSNKLNDNAKLYAEKALPPLWNAIKYFYETEALPDEKMRDELYFSSLNAGMALNITGTCFPHTMGYVLTEDFSLPHGFACAAFMTELVKRGMEFKIELAKEYFNLLGINYPEFEKIINSLTDLSGVAMSEDRINSYTENWVNIKNFINSPGGFTPLDAKELLRKMFLR